MFLSTYSKIFKILMSSYPYITTVEVFAIVIYFKWFYLCIDNALLDILYFMIVYIFSSFAIINISTFVTTIFLLFRSE